MSAAETATLTADPTPAVCSPLEGIALDGLAETIGNPFNPPSPGSDDPHQGIDLADRLAGSQVTLTGRGVLAVMDGLVAGIIQDRFPYGNAVILEVPLTESESDILGIGVPTPMAAPLLHPVLTCPQVDLPYPPNAGRSLYFLYAHMSEISDLQPGQQVGCGEQVGRVGDSGNALNPHLHLEVRVGPSQSRFESIAHYDNRATPAEMGLYCLWRVSGIFQLLDPGPILKIDR
jgi:murein DD-endopeptidase MepM/ murein hydrolase activator NlpD